MSKSDLASKMGQNKVKIKAHCYIKYGLFNVINCLNSFEFDTFKPLGQS